MLSPAERVLRARTAVHTSWANTEDRRKRTQKGRDAAFARYEKQVDPDNELSPEERRRRAEHLRRADMARLALLSSKARRAKKGGAASAQTT